MSMRPLRHIRRCASKFAADESGTVSLETLMVIALVSIPTLMFIMNYSNSVKDWILEKTPAIADEADNLLKR